MSDKIVTFICKACNDGACRSSIEYESLRPSPKNLVCLLGPWAGPEPNWQIDEEAEDEEA